MTTSLEKKKLWYLENSESKVRIPLVDKQVSEKVLSSFPEEIRSFWILKCDQPETEPSELFDGQKASFKVFLISGKNTFRTRSERLSLEGSILSACPPNSFIDRDLKVIIQGKDGRTNLCLQATFKEGTSSTHILFSKTSKLDLLKLCQWIEEEEFATQVAA